MTHRILRRVFAAALMAAICGISHAQDAKLQRGRYMALTGHCNNCHTAGYAQKESTVPEKDWLMGSGAQGWRGPWGTTYASNLRINVHAMSETDWVKYMKALKARPPMPWWSVRETTEDDLGAMHAYIKSLGPAGSPAQAFVPPGQEPKPPYIQYPMPKEKQ